MPELPRGTVTFLFTDIESSTYLWQTFPDAMPAALARHHAILNEAIAERNGHVFQIIGDSFHCAFASAPDGVSAALDAQNALRAETWGETGPLRVRMALHTDHAEVNAKHYEEGEYLSGEYIVLARTARLLSAGHGGQILLSASTAALVCEQLPRGVGLRDMGVHRVKDFSPQQIYLVTAPELPVSFPPLKTLGSLPNNLPVQLTSFIGREKEIQALKQQLNQVRMLTLTGPGGAGKTRLSLQIAAECVDKFKHGAWFVELAPLSDPALVPQVVATTLSLHEQTGRTILEVLKEYLSDKALLLVLDNCEHLIEPCAQLADTLLRRAPKLKIIASSREALGIAGEMTYAVPSLSFPTRAPSQNGNQIDPDALLEFEAVRLFEERARAVQPAFTVTASNAPALVEICERLDGVPLALELAAARVKALTVEQIAKRLDDRFRLLTGGNRAALPRHQTLLATVEWSYDLLSEPERVLLQRLSVFAGGWTLEAAEHICAQEDATFDVLELLMHLVDKSLVVSDPQENAARYRYLDTIRQFARDKLGSSGPEHLRDVSNAHLDYFLGFAQEVDQILRGAEQKGGLVILDRELGNLRAALTWAAQSGRTEAELKLTSALWRYWRVRSYFSEGRRWLEDSLSKGHDAPAGLRARALLEAGSLASYQADYTSAQQQLELSLELYRSLNDRRGMALSLNLLSHARMMTGDLPGSQRAVEEGLTMFRDLKDARGMGYSLYFLGTTLQSTGELEAARRALEESHALMQQVGDRWWIGNILIQLGWSVNREGEPTRALQMFDEALEISAQFDDTRGTARALLYIGEAKCSQGDYGAAREKYREALKLFREIGDKWWGTVCLEGLGYIASHQEEARRVALLLGAAEHMHEQLGAPVLPVYRETVDWSVSCARAQLGAQAFAEIWRKGRALSYERAIELAMQDER